MENNYEFYIIYMPKLAAALRNMGFPIIKVEANIKKPEYDVYWFKNTPEFRAAIPKAKEVARKM